MYMGMLFSKALVFSIAEMELKNAPKPDVPDNRSISEAISSNPSIS
jgi:hypothetical protein